MTCVVIVLSARENTIFIHKKHVKYNPYCMSLMMLCYMELKERNGVERDESQLTDECKWNLTIGESRYKLYTNQTKQ